MRNFILSVLLGVASISASGLSGLANTPPTANAMTHTKTHSNPATSALPSRAWVESYPALLRYANIPVLVPAFGSMSQSYWLKFVSQGPSTGLPGTVVNMSQDGYAVTLTFTSLPPWSTQEPIFMGNRTAFSFAGVKATPSLASYAWLDLPANTNFNHLSGLPITLRTGVVGYLSYFRNITGNGGSDTTLTWKINNYVYQVSVPIAAGSGGRKSAIALGNDMTPLTIQGVQRVIAKPFAFTSIPNDSQSKPPAYNDTVKLRLDLSSLPKTLNETSPVVVGPIYPLYRAGVHKGVGRGFTWQYEMTPASRISTYPTYALSNVHVKGTAHAGGTVKVSGMVSPTPPAGTQFGITWSVHTGAGQVHTYPPTEPLPWWGTPNNVSFSPLSDTRVNGNHFTATLPIPLAIYDLGPGRSETNRWYVCKPGLYDPQLTVTSARSNQVTLPLHIVPGAQPILPTDQAGPYLATGHNLPPVAAYNLAYYLMGSGTQSTSVPFFLPAWASGATDPYSMLHAFPLSSIQNIPGGYAAIQFQVSVNDRGGPSPKPWPADLSQAALTVFGVRGTANPYAAHIAHVKSYPVTIGKLLGRVYALPTGTLVMLTIDQTQYGVFAANPATASDTIDMARSLTEINGTSSTDPANAG